MSKRKFNDEDFEDVKDNYIQMKKKYKNRWMDQLLRWQFTSLDDTSLINEEYLLEDPSCHVMIYDYCKEDDMYIHPSKIISYKDAFAWRQYGVVKGFYWHENIYDSLSESFEELSTIIPKYLLSRLGYKCINHEKYTLPRKLVDHSCEQEWNFVTKKVLSIIIKNTFETLPEILAVSDIIVEYSMDLENIIYKWKITENDNDLSKSR